MVFYVWGIIISIYGTFPEIGECIKSLEKSCFIYTRFVKDNVTKRAFSLMRYS